VVRGASHKGQRTTSSRTGGTSITSQAWHEKLKQKPTQPAGTHAADQAVTSCDGNPTTCYAPIHRHSWCTDHEAAEDEGDDQDEAQQRHCHHEARAHSSQCVRQRCSTTDAVQKYGQHSTRYPNCSSVAALRRTGVWNNVCGDELQSVLLHTTDAVQKYDQHSTRSTQQPGSSRRCVTWEKGTLP
jgi:hypothetical protein